MDWSVLAAIAEIVGAVAIVMTLIYLAVQIRQSTATTTSNSMHTLLDDWRNYTQTWASDPELTSLHTRGSKDFESLTADEKYRFFLFMLQFVFQGQIADEMFEQGTISQYDRDVWVNFAISSFNTPGGRILWRQSKHIYTPKIAEIIEKGLADAAGQPSWMHLAEFLDMGEIEPQPNKRL
jgi:hypothetical protein